MLRFASKTIALCAAVMLAASPALAAATPPAADELQPIRMHPSWLPAGLGADATVILVPGTADLTEVTGDDIAGGTSRFGGDQYGRSVAIGFYDPHHPQVEFVEYPQALGVTVLGRPVELTGSGTYNGSVDVGTATGMRLADRAWAAQGRTGTIILNGYSQSAPIAMNIAYLEHRRALAGDPTAIPAENIVVVNGADTRFPNTGIETVIPSFADGAYTNGPRNEADTGDIRVISYCIRGDTVCGMGNPLADPFATAFYALPGATIHGKKGDLVNQYPVEKTWTVGNTTYVVLDAGNPWGVWARSKGIDVPHSVDDTLDALVPVPMPGAAATDAAGTEIPTPRAVQVQITHALGGQVPVTDPDARAQEAAAGTSTSTSTATTPSAPAAPVAPLAALAAADPITADLITAVRDLLPAPLR
ncbi:MAG: hypothetical protein QM662_10355 [Gordonia sp. (in: high G+C Gram-positive bacteria)]